MPHKLKISDLFIALFGFYAGYVKRDQRKVHKDFKKVIYLHLIADSFMRISPQSSEQIGLQLLILNRPYTLYVAI